MKNKFSYRVSRENERDTRTKSFFIYLGENPSTFVLKINCAKSLYDKVNSSVAELTSKLNSGKIKIQQITFRYLNINTDSSMKRFIRTISDLENTVEFYSLLGD